MDTKEMIASYQPKTIQAQELEKKIATLRGLVDSLNAKIGGITDMKEWMDMKRQRNCFLVDIELCKRKLYNLNNGRSANGDPEFGTMGNGTATRKPFID